MNKCSLILLFLTVFPISAMKEESKHQKRKLEIDAAQVAIIRQSKDNVEACPLSEGSTKRIEFSCNPQQHDYWYPSREVGVGEVVAIRKWGFTKKNTHSGGNSEGTQFFEVEGKRLGITDITFQRTLSEEQKTKAQTSEVRKFTFTVK